MSNKRNRMEKWEKETFHRSLVVLVTGIITIFVVPILIWWLIEALIYFKFIDRQYAEELLKSNGIWTFITLLFSAPVALFIWHFRDINAYQQIENDRKDVNLKEFQKIVEWVGSIDSNTDTSSPLIVSSVYNLLPFFRGDRGEDFINPALNLLISAWYKLQEQNIYAIRSMQFDSHYFPLKINSSNSLDELRGLLNNIKNTRNTFLAKAITKVLLSDGGDNLKRDPKIFNNLCLIGMDFNLHGLEHKKLRNLFVNIEGNLDNLELQGCNLDKFNFRGLKLNRVYLLGASLRETVFQDCSIFLDNLIGTDISGANLIDAAFNQVILGKPCTLEFPNNKWQGRCDGAFMLCENYSDKWFSLSIEEFKGIGIIFIYTRKQLVKRKKRINTHFIYGGQPRYSNFLWGYNVNNTLTEANNAGWNINPNWWVAYDD